MFGDYCIRLGGHCGWLNYMHFSGFQLVKKGWTFLRVAQVLSLPHMKMSISQSSGWSRNGGLSPASEFSLLQKYPINNKTRLAKLSVSVYSKCCGNLLYFSYRKRLFAAWVHEVPFHTNACTGTQVDLALVEVSKENKGSLKRGPPFKNYVGL